MQTPTTLTAKFSLLQSLGFQTPAHKSCATGKDVLAFFEQTKADRAGLDFDIDGMVISVESMQTLEAMGVDDQCHNAQIALKFPARGEFVRIKAIEWSFDGGSFATPVGIYDPVEISGAVCQRVSLKSYKWMETNRVGVGSIVRVVRSGDVIPTIPDEKADWLKFTPEVWVADEPTSCPHCGCKVSQQGAMLACEDEECFAKEANRIAYFFKSLKVKGLEVSSLRLYTKHSITLADFFIPDDLKTVQLKIEAANRAGANISTAIWAKVKQQLTA